MVQRTIGGRTAAEHIERREALEYAFHIVDGNGAYLTPAEQDTLREGLVTAYLTGTIRNIVEEHLDSEAIASTLGLSPRSRR